MFFRKTQGISTVPSHFGTSCELGADSLGLFNVQSGHQPVKLLPGKVPGFRTVPRPTISSLHCQPFVDQYKTIAFPKQRLDPVAS
jgi:hypothetical protein